MTWWVWFGSGVVVGGVAGYVVSHVRIALAFLDAWDRR